MNKYQEALSDLSWLAESDGGSVSMDEVKQCTETLQELVDKATPRKPNISKIIRSVSNFTAEYENQAFCPNCNTRLNIKGMCCPNNDCRQKIDWSNDGPTK